MTQTQIDYVLELVSNRIRRDLEPTRNLMLRDTQLRIKASTFVLELVRQNQHSGVELISRDLVVLGAELETLRQVLNTASKL